MKFLLVGSPQVGKTVLNDHLVNDIESVCQRLEQYSDSTEAPVKTYIDNDVASVGHDKKYVKFQAGSLGMVHEPLIEFQLEI